MGKNYLIPACISLLFISLCAKGQTPTTALAQLKNARMKPGYATDTNSVVLLNTLAEKYFYQNPDSALLLAKEALQLSKNQHFDKGTASAQNNIARSYYILGSYFPSLSASDEAMAISQKIGFKKGIGASYNNKGLIYLAQDRMHDAIPEFEKSLTYAEMLKDSTRIAGNNFNIGLCYDEIKQFDKAFIHLKKGKAIAEKIKDWHTIQMILNRMGETYYHSSNYPLALKHYTLALNYKPYQDNWEKSFAYSGLGQTYYAMDRYREAVTNTEKGLALSLSLKAGWDIQRAYNILAKSYAATGDYKNAYTSEANSKRYADSLFTEAKEIEINYRHLQEKKAENLKLLKENQINKQSIDLNRLLIALVSLFALSMVIILFVIVRSIKHKSALNKELMASNAAIALQKEEISSQREALVAINQTKDQVFSVIGHDLRSPFASILQALELIRYGDLDEDEQHTVFEDFYKQVTLVTGMINNLLVWANSQQMGGKLSLEEIDLVAMVNEVLSVFGFFSKNKSQQVLHTVTAPIRIQADPGHVRIILQNVVGNAIKFTPQNGIIEVFYTEAPGMHAVHIKDNGVGMSAEKLDKLFKVTGKAISEQGTDKEAGTGLGLMLIKQFTEENGGRMEVNSQPSMGSEFIIYFKACQA
ncbi:tetratricopeptide repeat-containing sensor histidine kinase [Mucilaginibacter psychrotolerans]|uniref:histidine kinase n=1 Tax=Mucilaginibacter psychrotolerans TaxID=1524096 RepID=A0A4Y8SNT3_9SPHI|nr:tetratricopeptide repeat protein [Mucilaginibacter psychrotolerans]TFF40300.1 tetratricopeptide repeat protein [Mucilaginibacter psychrotolerans]